MAGPASAALSAARCVLWHAGQDAGIAELLAALERRGVRPRRAATALGAMAELCAAAREKAAVNGRPAALVLLLAEPRSLPDLAPVMRSAVRYVPQAVVWVYEAAGSPRLRAVTPAELTSWTAEPEVTVMPRARSENAPEPAPGSRRTGGGAALRLTEDVHPGPETADAREQRSARDVLTPEELGMLLGDDEDERR